MVLRYIFLFLYSEQVKYCLFYVFGFVQERKSVESQVALKCHEIRFLGFYFTITIFVDWRDFELKYTVYCRHYY